MQFVHASTFTASLLVVAVALPAAAHDGRRFDIQTDGDGKIIAQGYISGDSPQDDGNGVVRDYLNAIHAHWANLPSNTSPLFSSANLPGFDLENKPEFVGDELTLTIVEAQKWANAPFHMFASGGHHNAAHNTTSGSGHSGGGHTITPHFMTLDPATEAIEVVLTNDTSENVRSDTLGTDSTIRLDNIVGTDEHYDLTFNYFADAGSGLVNAVAPDTDVYLLTTLLSVDDPNGPTTSDPIYIILSPSGMLVPGSHGLSLALEDHFGAEIPEPASLAILGLGGLAMLRRRR